MNRRRWLSMVAAALPAWRTSLRAEAPDFTEIVKIDVHSHVFEDIPALNAMLRRNNVRTMNVCNNGSDKHLATMHRIAIAQFRAHPDLFPFASTFDVTGVNDPGYSQKVITWRLEARYRTDYQYFAGSGEMRYDGRPTTSLGLPREVLEKFYNGNARRVIAFPA